LWSALFSLVLIGDYLFIAAGSHISVVAGIVFFSDGYFVFHGGGQKLSLAAAI
jgi:hypothetical protein